MDLRRSPEEVDFVRLPRSGWLRDRDYDRGRTEDCSHRKGSGPEGSGHGGCREEPAERPANAPTLRRPGEQRNIRRTTERTPNTPYPAPAPPTRYDPGMPRSRWLALHECDMNVLSIWHPHTRPFTLLSEDCTRADQYPPSAISRAIPQRSSKLRATGQERRRRSHSLSRAERLADIRRATWWSVPGLWSATGKPRNRSRWRRRACVICGLVTPANSATGKSVLNSRRCCVTESLPPSNRNACCQLRCVRRDAQLRARRSPTTVAFEASNSRSRLRGRVERQEFWDRQLTGSIPWKDLIGTGGQILLNISASPFYLHKRELRRDMLAPSPDITHSRCLVNQVGGNEQPGFDGSSFALWGPTGVDRASEVVRRGPRLL